MSSKAWAHAVSDNSSMVFEVMQRRYTEKLAELIVDECAKIADAGFGSDHFGLGISGQQLRDKFGTKKAEMVEDKNIPTWREVLFCHGRPGHIQVMCVLANATDYRYFSWNGRIYEAVPGTNAFKETNLLDIDIL